MNHLKISNDYLRDLVALLNMYKAIQGMIDRFDLDGINEEWAQTKVQYLTTFTSWYKDYENYLTQDDLQLIRHQADREGIVL